jgi:hypothetical protein
MSLIKAALALLLSTLCGAVPAGVAATIYCAIANFRANDGPFFPPPLLALLIVMPVAFLLLPLQVVVLIWRAIKGRPTLRSSGPAGAIGGAFAGLTVAYGLSGFSPSVGYALAMAAMGMLQGIATLVGLACVLALQDLMNMEGTGTPERPQ